MDIFRNQDQNQKLPSATPSPLTPPDLSEEAHKYRQSQEQGEIPFLAERSSEHILKIRNANFQKETKQ